MTQTSPHKFLNKTKLYNLIQQQQQIVTNDHCPDVDQDY